MKVIFHSIYYEHLYLLANTILQQHLNDCHSISFYEIKVGYLGYFQILAFTSSTIMKIFSFIEN